VTIVGAPGPRTVVVHADAEATTTAAAARLVTRLVETLADRAAAHVVLTGGRAGIRTLEQVRSLPAAAGIDWSRMHVWWGDERFRPADDPERNAVQARRALLDHVPIPPRHVHEAPGSDAVTTPEEAAERYAAELARYAEPGDQVPVPRFDVLMLSIGEDCHVASLFPGHPGVYVDHATVAGVRGCPKPPPERVTLTFPAITAAAEVWILAVGAGKAPAVALALAGGGRVQVPAAEAHGRRATVWLLDREAARDVPRGIVRPASP
jgi:6-phosphogluconolactonase